MKYTVHYWRANLVELTGLTQGTEIGDEEVMELITSQKVNVMVHHARPHGDNPQISYVYIDDLNHRFQQR